MGGGCEGIIWDPLPPTIFAEPAAQYSSVPVRCTRCRRPNVLCSSGGLACAARWPPTLPFPFFLTLWHALHCCAALHECGAAPSEVKGGAVRRKDGTLLHRENKKTGKSQKRTFPSRLAGRPTGVKDACMPSREDTLVSSLPPKHAGPRCSCSRHALASVPQPFCSSCLSSNTTRCTARSLS